MIDSARVWRELDRSMAGLLLLPGDDQFESLRMLAVNRYPSPRPQAIARCAGPTDVSQARVASAVVKAVTTNRIPGQARELAFTPMGGAYNQMSADATAFVHRDELFLLERTSTSDPGEPAATRAVAARWLSQVRDVLAGYGTGRAYQNFPDPELADPLPAYYGTNLPRLREVKARHDPDDFFHHGQSIPPTRASIARGDRTIEGRLL